RGDEEHAEHLPVVLLELADRVVVQDGLIDRHRDELLHLEAERGFELLLGEERQGDLADDHTLVPDTEPHLPAAEPTPFPQLADRLRNGGGIADLTVLDRAGRQRALRSPNHRRLRPGRKLSRADGGGPYVEPAPTLGHSSPFYADGALRQVALDSY